MSERSVLIEEDGADQLAGRTPQPDVTSAKAPPPWARVALDVFERVFVLAMFGGLAWSMYVAVRTVGGWVNPIQLTAEGLNVVLILLRRRATNVSYRPMDWAVSLGAVSLALAARPGTLPPLTSPVVAAGFVLTGFGLQVWAKLTLRRSFGITPANRGVIIAGPYRMVRHPMYFGYLLGWIGFYIVNPTLWNTNVYAICLVLQWIRIEAEERVLAADPSYAAYKAEVPYKVIPRLY